MLQVLRILGIFGLIKPISIMFKTVLPFSRKFPFLRKFCCSKGNDREMKFSKKTQGNLLISKKFSGNSIFTEPPLGLQSLEFSRYFVNFQLFK